MLSRFFVGALALAMLAPSRPAMSWGGFGHEVVGAIAETRMSTPSITKARELLLVQTLQSVSTWADAVRPRRQETAPLHYINFPWDSDEPSADDLATSVGNVYTAVTGYSERLADATRPHAERAEALMFLVHFVGDLHQPMHCGLEADLGGNLILLRDRGYETNLHRVWDSGMFWTSYRDKSPEEFALSLMEQATPETIASYAASKRVEDWIRESRAIMKSSAYKYHSTICEPGIDGDYVDYHLPIAEQRLIAAGIRLGDLLETIFTTGKSPLPPPPVALPARREGDDTTGTERRGRRDGQGERRQDSTRAVPRAPQDPEY